jgi:hypothetical protein
VGGRGALLALRRRAAGLQGLFGIVWIDVWSVSHRIRLFPIDWVRLLRE